MENQEVIDFSKDWFITALTNHGISTYLWVYGMDKTNPTSYLESTWPVFFSDKIILEINDGETVISKICDKCFETVSEENDWLCQTCNI